MTTMFLRQFVGPWTIVPMYFITWLTLTLLGCTFPRNHRLSEASPVINEHMISGITFRQDRIFLKIPGPGGDTATFYTDTGGGRVIYPGAIEKLGLSIDSTYDGDRWVETVEIASVMTSGHLPTPIGPHYLYRKETPFHKESDGMLGANWFAGKRWRFDYLRGRLYVIDSVRWDRVPESARTALGFLKDSLGNKLTHFPRIPVVVAGDTIQALFDTGAMALLSDEAQQPFGGQETIGISFIIDSIFGQWHVDHPKWPVITKGDRFSDQDLIQVPGVTIGTHTTGPVWFARRPDENFTQYMSQWMDQPVQGAIGGSCLRYFNSIVVDYRADLAYFE